MDEPSYHDGDIGAAANLYAYGNDNPIKFSDPTGHFCLSAFWTGFTIDVLLTAFVPAIAGFFDGFGITLRAMSHKFGFKYAEKLLELQMVKCTSYGMFNSLATAIRSIIFKLTGAVVNNLSGSLIGYCISSMASSIKFLSLFFSAGSFISGALDKISDGKLDDRISIPFKSFSWIYNPRNWLA